MEIRFGKNEIKRILENYYKEKEDFDGKISIRCESQLRGYGMGEYDEAVVKINLNGVLDVLGTKVEMKRTIEEETVKGIFKEMLSDAGYNVDSIRFDSGISSTSEGYGMAEHTVKRPYFNGLVVTVKNKTLVR